MLIYAINLRENRKPSHHTSARTDTIFHGELKQVAKQPLRNHETHEQMISLSAHSTYTCNVLRTEKKYALPELQRTQTLKEYMGQELTSMNSTISERTEEAESSTRAGTEILFISPKDWGRLKIVY